MLKSLRDFDTDASDFPFGESIDVFLRGGDLAPPLSVEESASLSDLLEEVQGASECLETVDEKLVYGVALLLAFVQENYVGPPLSGPLTAVSERVAREARAALREQGEQLERSVRAPHLLCLARHVLWQSELDGESETWRWRARWLAKQRELLSGRIDVEQELACWARVEGGGGHWERALCLAAVERFREAHELFEEGMAAEGVKEARLTGALGRRTKYQTFDVAQLVLEVAPTREEEVKEKEKEEVMEVQHAEDNCLMEHITLTEHERHSMVGEMTARQQCGLLVMCQLVAYDGARDEQAVVLALPWATGVLEQHRSWCVHSTALYVRSLLEAQWSKTRDRAALQLQALLDQWADGDGLQPHDSNVIHRFRLVFECGMPSRPALQLATARSYLRIGAAASAAQLFESLGRTQDRISCLTMQGRADEAAQLVRDELVRLETEHVDGDDEWRRFELLCLLGDLTTDESLWEQVWQESEHRYAMARRLQGTAAVRRGEWREAASLLGEALAINAAHPNAQFSRGCALLRLDECEAAVPCFAAAVHGEPEDGQAWANLSVALRGAGRLKEAYTAALQAARHSNRDYRVIENLIELAQQLGHHQQLINGCRQLCDLNHQSQPRRCPLVALAYLDTQPWKTSGASRPPLHVETLLDEVVGHWSQLPEPYVVRARYRMSEGRNREALEDAERATRLARAAVEAETDEAMRVQYWSRLKATLTLHIELLKERPHDIPHVEPHQRVGMAHYLSSLPSALPECPFQTWCHEQSKAL